MIRAVVRSIDLVDELPTDDEQPFVLAMTAQIGPEGETGSDMFQFVVCNPAGLAEHMEDAAPKWLRGYLVVRRFDLAHVRKTVQNLVDRCNGATGWEAFCERLNRYLLWEFEDYRAQDR